MFFYKNKDILDIGGSGLLYKYNHSIIQLLAGIYPDYDWLPWRFNRCPNSFWDDVKNQRKFLEWVEKQLNKNWYKITTKVLKKLRIWVYFSRK